MPRDGVWGHRAENVSGKREDTLRSDLWGFLEA